MKNFNLKLTINKQNSIKNHCLELKIKIKNALNSGIGKFANYTAKDLNILSDFVLNIEYIINDLLEIKEIYDNDKKNILKKYEKLNYGNSCLKPIIPTIIKQFINKIKKL